MCARFARLLAAEGWRVVRLDLYGCGDSAGEFRDASWERWVEDLRTEARLIGAEGGPSWLWCVRAGALFAPQVLEMMPTANLLLWQPVPKGATHLQQFLRQSMAAQLFGQGKRSVAELAPAQRLATGETIEVGGYELSPAVASGLQAAVLLPADGRGRHAAWLDVASGQDAGVSPATLRASEVLRANDWQVEVGQVAGAPFWQSVEVVENKPLLQLSRDVIARLPSHPASIQSHAA